MHGTTETTASLDSRKSFALGGKARTGVGLAPNTRPVPPRPLTLKARVTFLKRALSSVAILLFAVQPPLAQQYPAKTVRLIVPFAAGGSTDIIGRTVAQKLNEAWGQPVLVDNRPGGSTVIGTDLVAKAPPDGYMMLVTPAPFTIVPSLTTTKLP